MKNFSKFKRGDRVKTNYGAKCKIIGVYRKEDVDEFMYHVESDTGFRSDYKESELLFLYDDLEDKSAMTDEHLPDKCPKCKTPWTRTAFGARVWKDCTSCKKTAEELCDQGLKTSKKDVDYDEDEWYNVLKDWGSD